MNTGTLYIVATPIGNLQDITLRAIETLKSVDYVACEDTRKTGILIKSLGFETHPAFISYYEQNEKERIPNILNLLINDRSVALVSDGGTPTISDPGFRLVRECNANNIKVVSIPGASAVITALAGSGLPTDKFTYLGFLPKKQGHRLKLLKEVLKSNEKLEATIVLYEAPHRLVKVLEDMRTVFGNINVTLARELTKIYEEQVCASLDEFLEKYKKLQPKGEFVILFSPKK